MSTGLSMRPLAQASSGCPALARSRTVPTACLRGLARPALTCPPIIRAHTHPLLAGCAFCSSRLSARACSTVAHLAPNNVPPWVLTQRNCMHTFCSSTTCPGSRGRALFAYFCKVSRFCMRVINWGST